MLPKWTVVNNYELARIPEGNSIDLLLPLEDTVNVTTTLISGNLPSGVSLNYNKITGIADTVSSTVTSTFVIRASTTSGVIDRTFKIVITDYPKWTVGNYYELISTSERISLNVALPLESTVGVTTTLISGSLPNGVRIESNSIVGTPLEVSRTTVSTFVLRATNTEGNSVDRTFKIKVEGADDPVWITPEGALGVGPNNVFYILDSSIIDYQLSATDPDLSAGETLEYYISDGDGELPPGISLSRSGRLTGVVDPLLALDINDRLFGVNYYLDDIVYGSDNGFESFYYDTTLYDYNIPARTPRKLNRTYEFYATVADNVTTVRRKFTIFVISDDFAHADNALMLSDSGIFTADLTFLRTPVWLTASDLGIRRANNYITIYLETLDPTAAQLLGKETFTLETINDDGTPSILPPGTRLDSNTGEVAGIVPFQPAVTKDYKFTVTSSRYGQNDQIVTVFGTGNYESLSGSTSIRIAKLPRTLTDGLDDLQSLVGEEIAISNRYYTVSSVNGTHIDYDSITFAGALQPTNSANPITVSRTASSQDYFYVSALTDADKSFYTGKFLNYSDVELYEIENIYPYVEWIISKDDSAGAIEIVTDITGEITISMEDTLETFLTNDIYPAYATTTLTGGEVTSISLIIPATANNRNLNFIKSLFHTNDSSDIVVTLSRTDDRVQLDTNLTRVLNVSNQLSFGFYTGDFFSKTFGVNDIELAQKTKTFTIKLLGEVDSTITWNTSTDLGTLNANRFSTLAVNATTSVINAVVKYYLVSGSLPPGLLLNDNGEITGKVPIQGTDAQLGLTFFDTATTTFDGATLTMDRVYTFSILARDRYGYSAVSRTFTLRISDADNLTYSNIYIKPFLKTEQKNAFLSFINDAKVINPRSVYRPSDTNFGIQKELKCLVYAGIETSLIGEFVSATTRNHKRKKFLLGDITTGVAKIPGTNTTVYEIVYVELIDPAKPTTGSTSTYFNILNNSNKITVDSIKYEAQDDTFKTLDTSPWRNRPISNTITIDNNAVQVSQNSDTKKYISNIDNMRDRIRAIGSSSSEFLPLWMRTAQGSTGLSQLNYTLALPLVYCKPGTSESVKLSIQNYVDTTTNNFKFNDIDFDIDRYIIDSSTGNSNEQYIVFANYQYNV